MAESEGIAERLAWARERIAAAAGRAGRDPAGVKLMAVTKTVPAERVREAAACGQMLFRREQGAGGGGKNPGRGARAEMAHDRPSPDEQGEGGCPVVRLHGVG